MLRAADRDAPGETMPTVRPLALRLPAETRDLYSISPSAAAQMLYGGAVLEFRQRNPVGKQRSPPRSGEVAHIVRVRQKQIVSLILFEK